MLQNIGAICLRLTTNSLRKKSPQILHAYVTQKAIDGIFYEVSLEEQKIRKDPAARITDLLKKVFGSQQAK